MSKQVDERVVSMRFDNKQFEANVKTSMSTIDKLKEKLKFKDSAKGLEQVSSAAKKVDMKGLSSSVDTVKNRFSALEVMGVTALANITNSAVNAGKRIVSSLTIDPVRSGFNEYELKMGSIQTIMASTGESLETVNQYLNELNKYSDQTIYSFQDMTQNIGKFTNAGVKLEDAVAAIKGISNEAAVSGANANEASRAMYNFAQALSSGYVKLIDWKSIELANMATVDFKEQLIESAVAAGTLKKASNGMYKTVDGNTLSATKNFNETLQDQWMTSEVLITTLKKYADETTEIGKKATAAATEVKTFSQLMDTLKESAQSGWAQTWEIIFGDFNKGKALWTNISNVVGGFIDKMSDARNALLKGALGSKWDTLTEKIEEAGVSTEDFTNKLKEVAKEEGHNVDDLIKKHGSLAKAMAKGELSTGLVIKTLQKLAGAEKDTVKNTENAADKLKYFQEVVNKVWHGDYANGEARVKALTEAGYDYAKVQSLVNKTVDGHKLTLEDLSDAQLKAVGYTDEQIVSIRKLAKEAENSGTPLNELINSLNKPSGRELLLESFANAFKGLGTVLKSVKTAWNEIFNPLTLEQRSSKMYSLIENIHKFSEKLVVSKEAADKFVRTFKGVFALLDLIATVVMGPIKIAFKLLTAVLGEFGFDLLDVTVTIGDAIVKFRDWVKGILNFDGAAKTIANAIRGAIRTFKDWIQVLKQSDNIPRDIVKGLIKGFGDGIKTVAGFASDLANTIINTVKKLLGIHSPSTVFMEIGQNIIDGLVLGLKKMGNALKTVGGVVKNIFSKAVNAIKAGFPELYNTVKTISGNLLEFIKNIDFGTVLAGALIGGTLFTIKKVADVVETVMNPFEDIGIGVKRLFTGMGKMFAGVGWELKTHAMMNLAKAILILVGALLLLTLVEPKKLWSAIGAVAALGAIIGGLAIVLSKMGDTKEIFAKAMALVGISATLLIVAFAIKKLADVDIRDGGKALGMMAAAVLGVGLILLAIERVIRYDADYMKVALMVLGIGLTLKIVLSVIEQAGSLKKDKLIKGLAVLAILSTFCFALLSVSWLAGKNGDQAGKMFLKMSFAMLIMVAVIKIAGNLKPDEIFTGLLVIAALETFCIALMAVSMLAGKNAGEAGKMFSKFATAILIMAFALKIMASLETMDIVKGIAIIVLLGVFCVGLTAVSKLAGEHADKAGSMMMKISVAILILTGAIFLLGLIKTDVLKKGLLALAAITLMIGGLIAVTYFAEYSKKIMGTLIMLGVLIGIMAAVMVGLTFVDTGKLIASAGSLVGVMVALSLLMKATGSMSTQVGKSVLTIGALLLVVAGLAGLVMLLTLVPSNKVIPNVLSLCLLMTSFAVAMKIISTVSSVSKDAVKALLPMTLVAAGLGLIVAGLALVPVNGSILEKVLALSILLNSFASAMLILSLVRMMSVTATAALGPMFLVTVGLAAIVGLLAPIQVEGSLIEKTAALSLLLISFSAALLILSLIGPIASMAVPAVPPLLILIAAIAAVVTALGLLMKIPAFKQILADGGEALGLIGAAIGKFVGGIIGGVAAGIIDAISSTLPGLGTALSDFMNNATDFFTGIKMVDGKALAGIGILALAIAALTVGSFITGIAEFCPYSQSFAEMGSDLSAFMVNALPFILNSKMIDTASITGIKALAETILILTGANILDGIARFLGADSSIATFAGELPLLGTGLKDFVTNLGTFEEAQVKTVDCAAQAVQKLAQAADKIPNQGGWIAKICGDNSISTFGSYLPELGTYLSGFVENLGTFTEAQVVSADCAAQAVVKIAEAADKIPNEGGWWGKITGENTISTFGSYLPDLGTNLAGFITNLGTFSEAQVASTACAADAVVKLAEAAKAIPAEGGWWQKLVGDKSLSEFGDQLPKLGEHIKGFANKIGTLEEGVISSTEVAVNVIKALTGLANADIKGTTEHLGDFGSETITFAANVKTFCTNMSAIPHDSITTSINNVDSLLTMFQQFGNINVDLVTSFGESLKNIGATGIDKFVSAFNEAEKKVVEAGAGMMANLIDGATEKTSKVEEAFSDIGTKGAESLKGGYQGYYNAGVYLIEGLVAGLNDKAGDAYSTVETIASNIEARMRKALEINSPSKVFADIGMGIPEGLALGIENYSSLVTASTDGISETAVDGVRDSISKIASVLNSDMDTQPTIRPVLDLSDIEAGAGSIRGILGFGTSVGVMSDLHSINSSMNRRSQNGANGDVVSAIDKLRGDISNLEHASYTINGITYAEGSDVAEAIQTIIRTARVERRI